MNVLRQTKPKILSGILALAFSAGVMAQGATQETVWERPNTELSQYSKIILTPLDISDVKVLKPSWEQDNPEEWSFDPEATETIQSMYSEIMSKEISKDGGYPIVAESGDDVLQLEVEFLSIMPFTKPGTQGRTKDYVISTLGSGNVVVSAELRDSETGLLLIFVEGKHSIGTEYKELSRENHIANVKETFSIWGKRVRARLDRAHGK